MSVLHDKPHALSRREDVCKAIDDAHTMLRRLRAVTKSAKTPLAAGVSLPLQLHIHNEARGQWV
ncbi:hypothetical protein H9L39_20025 [Fusarium oxysporum f. sp. albedinis]|nr:hypothetical protein H9L39_20025 [Fusarium oxysporum f. sp. albedinis]